MMALYPKEIADRLYAEGKMPEWFYRQHYKTFQENWIDYHNRNKRKRSVADQEQIIDAAAEKTIQKALEDIIKSIDK